MWELTLSTLTHWGSVIINSLTWLGSLFFGRVALECNVNKMGSISYVGVFSYTKLFDMDKNVYIVTVNAFLAQLPEQQSRWEIWHIFFEAL